MWPPSDRLDFNLSTEDNLENLLGPNDAEKCCQKDLLKVKVQLHVYLFHFFPKAASPIREGELDVTRHVT